MALRKNKNNIEKVNLIPKDDLDNKSASVEEGTIDQSVFEEISVDEYKVPKTTTIDSNMLPEDRTRSSLTKTRIFKTSQTLDLSNAERFNPPIELGLNDDQVASRIKEGYVNYSDSSNGRSYRSIFFGNIFTFFNVLMFIVAIAIIVFGDWANNFVDTLAQLFFMVIVSCNIIIGIIQEIKSKKTVQKLKLVTAPTAIVIRNGEKIAIPVNEIVLDDIIYLELGKQICSDAIVIKGDIEVNESMLTGESVPIKKSVDAQLFSGSFVTSGSCYARVDKVGSANYISKLSSYAKKYQKPKSELKKSIGIIIRAVSVIILPIAIFMIYKNIKPLNDFHAWQENIPAISGSVIGMIPSGMFLLVSVALATSVIRLAKKRILVQDLYCIEMLARVDTLCLDKTGTITDGSMRVNNVVELKGASDEFSINEIMGNILTATEDNNQTALALAERFGYSHSLKPITTIPFSSQKKLSAVTFEDAGTYILGAPEFVMKETGVRIEKIINENASQGYRVLMLAHSHLPIKDDRLPAVRRAVCLIVIEDHIREDAKDVIKWFKDNNVDVKIISGDNPVTVSEVARRVGVDKAELFISLDGLSNHEVIEASNKYTVFGRVTPEQKCLLVKALKARGRTVAMTGDGVNDILAMKEADCAVAIASGSEAARNVSHLVLLDSNFTSMPDVVTEGRRVVNNIQQSSSLFLMKTFMSIVLSIICLILNTKYFFQTNNNMILETFVIAFPSFVLALQPNKQIIKGNFLLNVISKSIPGGVALVTGVMTVYLFTHFGYLPGVEVGDATFTTMIVAVVIFSGIMSLIKICQPFNAYRLVMVLFSILFSALALIIAPTVFGVELIKFNVEHFVYYLLVLSIVIINYFIISLFVRLISKIKIGESDKERKQKELENIQKLQKLNK